MSVVCTTLSSDGVCMSLDESKIKSVVPIRKDLIEEILETCEKNDFYPEFYYKLKLL